MADILNALDFQKMNLKWGQNFLLLGTDSYLADIAIAHIKASYRDYDFDSSIVYADEVKAGELAEYLDTFTIFSSTKLIIIRSAELLNKQELEVLGDYFDNPSDLQSVVIISQKANSKFKAWKKIISGCLTISCDPPKFAGEIRAWLTTELRRIGKVMTPKAINEFTQRIELDYNTAANELNKIALLVGERKQITNEDLAALAGTRAGTLIDFYRALGRKQEKAALEAVDLMLEADWEPLQIQFALLRFFTNLWKIQLLRQRHISDTEISSRHLSDIFFSQRKEYLDFAKSYPIKSLEIIMEILLKTDYYLKSSTVDKRLQLELCVISIIAA